MPCGEITFTCYNQYCGLLTRCWSMHTSNQINFTKKVRVNDRLNLLQESLTRYEVVGTNGNSQDRVMILAALHTRTMHVSSLGLRSNNCRRIKPPLFLATGK
ncbi:hypothetical protein YC2023_016719 [Brassica napus]